MDKKSYDPTPDRTKLIEKAGLIRNKMIDRNTVQFRRTDMTDDVLIDSADIIQQLTVALTAAASELEIVRSAGADYDERSDAWIAEIRELEQKLSAQDATITKSLTEMDRNTMTAGDTSTGHISTAMDYESLPLLGSPFTPFETYVYFDGRQTFAMRSTLILDLFYIVNTVDESDDGEKLIALAVAVDAKLFQRIRSGAIPFRDAFEKAGPFALYRIIWTLDTEGKATVEVKPIRGGDVPERWLPVAGAHLNSTAPIELPTETGPELANSPTDLPWFDAVLTRSRAELEAMPEAGRPSWYRAASAEAATSNEAAKTSDAL